MRPVWRSHWHARLDLGAGFAGSAAEATPTKARAPIRRSCLKCFMAPELTPPPDASRRSRARRSKSATALFPPAAPAPYGGGTWFQAGMKRDQTTSVPRSCTCRLNVEVDPSSSDSSINPSSRIRRRAFSTNSSSRIRRPCPGRHVPRRGNQRGKGSVIFHVPRKRPRSAVARRRNRRARSSNRYEPASVSRPETAPVTQASRRGMP